MTPLKAKTLIPKTAVQSEFSEEVCKQVIELFYKHLREKLSSMSSKKIVVDNLGAFYCKERTMESTKRKYERILEHVKDYSDGPRKEQIERGVSEQLENIKRIQEEYKTDKERKQFFFIHKQKMLDEQAARDLEEKESNS